MIVYRRRLHHGLFGFGDPFAEVPVLGRPLAAWQEDAVAHAGGELREVADEGEIPENRYVIFDEDVFFTRPVAAFVLKQARKAGGSQRYGLADNGFNRRFVLPDAGYTGGRMEFALRYRERGEDREEQVIIPQRIYRNWVPIPAQVVPEGRYQLDQCDTLIARMLTPFHLLQVNIYAILARSLWLRRLVPPWQEKRQAHLNTRTYFRGLRLLNRRGARCKVHPTAVLEGVEMGDDVTIGAYAVLRQVRIGSGSTVEDQASITHSVLGANNYIANKNHLAFCLTYDDVFLIHGPYQFSVFGKATAVFAVINCDVRMDRKTIKIDGPEGPIDTRQNLLGIAYGHGVKVAGGNIIAPGRIVPNGHVELPPEFMMR